MMSDGPDFSSKADAEEFLGHHGPKARDHKTFKISSNYFEQMRHAEKSMAKVMEVFTKQQEAQGYIVTTFQDEVICTPSPARLAYDKIYVNFNDSGFAQFRRGFEAAAQVARDAKLPSHFRWGHNAMEQFNFGKERAAKAIMGEE
jgi:hypothetical protein